jgi:hypothetical protein
MRLRPEERHEAARRLAGAARAAGLGGNSVVYQGRRTTSLIGNAGIGLGRLVSLVAAHCSCMGSYGSSW